MTATITLAHDNITPARSYTITECGYSYGPRVLTPETFGLQPADVRSKMIATARGCLNVGDKLEHNLGGPYSYVAKRIA